MNELNEIQRQVISVPVFLLAIIFHEVSHGFTAFKLGDPTAKEQGRLTLNPLKHLDPLGTLAFFLIHIGWAKPVPVNPAYFKNPARDMLLVSLAGPGSNLLFAMASIILFKGVVWFQPMLPGTTFAVLTYGLSFSVLINILLMGFNLMPIPPLDGSKILAGLLPPGLAGSYLRLERFGFVLILLLFWLGMFSRLFQLALNITKGVLTSGT